MESCVAGREYEPSRLVKALGEDTHRNRVLEVLYLAQEKNLTVDIKLLEHATSLDSSAIIKVLFGLRCEDVIKYHREMDYISLNRDHPVIKSVWKVGGGLGINWEDHYDLNSLRLGSSLFRKTRELINLKNKVERYWKRLGREGVWEAERRAKNKPPRYYIGVHEAYVDEHGELAVMATAHKELMRVPKKEGCSTDDNVCEALIELAKESVPGFYRKFKRENAKWEKARDELKDLVDKYDAIFSR